MAAIDLPPVLPSVGQSRQETGGKVQDARFARDLIEFAVAFGLILAAVWTAMPYQRWLSYAALMWITLSTWRSFDGVLAMGYRVAHFWRALWIPLVSIALSALAIYFSHRAGMLRIPRTPHVFFERFWLYALWSFLQEFVLLNFFLLRLTRLLPKQWMAVSATACCFAITHLPNPVLAPLTMIWGMVACATFLAYRNFYMPAIAHAILGICIALTIPGRADHNMRVGYGYMTYRPHAHSRPEPEPTSGARSTIPYRP
ncbi:type II CAAX prenyl endopeptidase Rce1 family protein [Acidicapsa dinghuensis]|uniref:Type II CAAX prenyl endopeptidase Rce1 family protein n=1 Tax=Acidicapsa dinghuensis TaxID=2218256 RepID=A0ABW1EIN7_9BACT|nr:CPBP family intramembrane glutamic endopeptidase [Acidicapsa dinghuensis]